MTGAAGVVSKKERRRRERPQMRDCDAYLKRFGGRTDCVAPRRVTARTGHVSSMALQRFIIEIGLLSYTSNEGRREMSFGVGDIL